MIKPKDVKVGTRVKRIKKENRPQGVEGTIVDDDLYELKDPSMAGVYACRVQFDGDEKIRRVPIDELEEVFVALRPRKGTYSPILGCDCVIKSILVRASMSDEFDNRLEAMFPQDAKPLSTRYDWGEKHNTYKKRPWTAAENEDLLEAYETAPTGIHYNGWMTTYGASVERGPGSIQTQLSLLGKNSKGVRRRDRFNANNDDLRNHYRVGKQNRR